MTDSSRQQSIGVSQNVMPSKSCLPPPVPWGRRNQNNAFFTNITSLTALVPRNEARGRKSVVPVGLGLVGAACRGLKPPVNKMPSLRDLKTRSWVISTPTGFHIKARGCAYPRYPGWVLNKNINPNGVAHSSSANKTFIMCNPVGVENPVRTSTQGSALAQPWALMSNPLGVVFTFFLSRKIQNIRSLG